MGKKYFEKSLSDYDGTHIEICRKCPICEEQLSLTDFESTNIRMNVKIYDVWHDKRIAVPCCRCITILEKMEVADNIETFFNYRCDVYHLKLTSKSIFQEVVFITLLKKEVLKNLRRFGLID